MKLPSHNSIDCNLPGRERGLLFLLIAVALVLSACATRRAITVTPPPLQDADAMVPVADVDVLAVSPAMQAFLDRYILPYRDLDTRLDLLTLAVVEHGVLGFDYDDTHTMTAVETFDKRAGNCISHANMLIALARRAGLEAQYQEIVIRPEWSSREDTLLVRKHINVLLKSPLTSRQVDISGTNRSERLRHNILSDREGKALYFNNLGAEALIDNDLSTAYGFIAKAIETEPHIPDPWVNLGVVFSRNKQLAEAEISHKTALQIDAHEHSAMSNLYTVYKAQKKYDAAEKLQKRVNNYRENNPYYLLMLSKEALEQSRFKDAIKLLKRAVRRNEHDHRLHYALAKTLYLSGDHAAAQSSLDRARELALGDDAIDYTLPLKRLIELEQM